MNLTPLALTLLALVLAAAIVQLWTSATGDPAWWRYGAAALLTGGFYEWLQLRQISLEAGWPLAHNLRLGRDEAIDLNLNNAGARHLDLQYVPGLPAELVTDPEMRRIPVRAGAVATATIRVRPVALGRYEWARLPVRVRGALGLAWWPLATPLNTTVTVVPDLLGAVRGAAGDVHHGQHNARTGAGMELHHLREYVTGDARHTVDWKATARTQRLITRVQREETHLEVMLVLDVGRTSRTHVGGLSQFAHFANLTARFAELASAQGDPVGMVAAADVPHAILPPQSGARAVQAIRRALVDLQPETVETDLIKAGLTVQRVAKRRCLIVLFTDLYGQSLTGSFGRTLKLWRSRHLPLVVSLIGDEVSALSSRKAHLPLDPYLGLAATEYSQALAANAGGAGRLGASAIIARPAELQARVFERYQLLKRQHRV